MLRFLPAPVLFAFALFLYALLFIFLGCYVFPVAPLKLIPYKPWQNILVRYFKRTPYMWTLGSEWIFALTTKVHWDVHIDHSINKLKSYLLICNHASMIDIFAIQRAIYKIAPSTVYFLKSQLMYVPILGWGCWVMDYPVMRRYSKAYLRKHPHKQGLDIQRTRKSCMRYKENPITIVNFAEGTRFTQEKHDKQRSPYKNLLKPRAGGIAHALNVMGTQIKDMLNVTVIYPRQQFKIMDIFAGKVRKVTVHIEALKVNPKLRGDYNSPLFREYFQSWLNQLWQKKDDMISHFHNIEKQTNTRFIPNK